MKTKIEKERSINQLETEHFPRRDRPFKYRVVPLGKFDLNGDRLYKLQVRLLFMFWLKIDEGSITSMINKCKSMNKRAGY